jgi:site-specific recombinase XerD
MTDDLNFNAQWLDEYLVTLPSQRASTDKEYIQCAYKQLRLIRPHESFFEQLRSTEWIPPWVKHVSAQLRPEERVARIQALGRLWSWLFDCKRIDNNVLACFDPYSEALRQPPLTLHHNLQRPIAQFFEEHGTRRLSTRRKFRRILLNFNKFVHRFYSTSDDLRIDEELVRGWLREIAHTTKLQGVCLIAGVISRFLDYLVDKGHLTENPFDTLQRRYEVQNRAELIAGLIRPNGRENLRPALSSPRFKSFLSSHLEAFIALKKAMGRRYTASAKELQRFDRFISTVESTPDFITRELIDLWLAGYQQLNPKTLKKRIGLVRQFCIYMVRFEQRTYVPGRGLTPCRIPEFKPYVYSSEEVRALLHAALNMPAGRDPLRPKVFYTILLILYSSGLRIGEALRLRLRDTDLQSGTLFIRETKFFKSRVVPISQSLCNTIKEYLQERLTAAASPDSFLFLNFYARPYSPDKFAEGFHRLLEAACVPHRPTTRRPRVYDMRHTFAVTNLMRWYQKGDDLMARLPLLSTYMGHANVLSTQEYLRATPELLREASQRFERTYGSVIKTRKEVTNVSKFSK